MNTPLAKRAAVLVALVTLALFVTLLSQRLVTNLSTPRTGLAQDRKIKRDYQSTFNQVPFQTITNSAAVRQVVQSIYFNGGVQLTSEQQTALRTSLEGLITLFTQGGIETYWSFRKPLGRQVTFNSTLLKQVRERNKLFNPALTSQEVLTEGIRSYSRGTFYAGYLSGICVDEGAIDRCIGRTNVFGKRNFAGVWTHKTSRWEDLSDPMLCMERHHTLGVDGQLSAITISPTPQELIRRNGSVTWVSVYWVVKPHDSFERDLAFPLIAQFYWSEADSAWYPCALMRASVWNYDKIRIKIFF